LLSAVVDQGGFLHKFTVQFDKGLIEIYQLKVQTCESLAKRADSPLAIDNIFHPFEAYYMLQRVCPDMPDMMKRIAAGLMNEEISLVITRSYAHRTNRL